MHGSKRTRTRLCTAYCGLAPEYASASALAGWSPCLPILRAKGNLEAVRTCCKLLELGLRFVCGLRSRLVLPQDNSSQPCDWPGCTHLPEAIHAQLAHACLCVYIVLRSNVVGADSVAAYAACLLMQINGAQHSLCCLPQSTAGHHKSASSMAAPDYSELFASESLLDLTIVIAEEGAEAVCAIDTPPASKRRRTPRSTAAEAAAGADADAETAAPAADSSAGRKVLPGHSIVLFGCSSFCKTKLQSWSSSSSNGKLEICITTPPGALHKPCICSCAHDLLQQDCSPSCFTAWAVHGRLAGQPLQSAQPMPRLYELRLTSI